MSVTKLKKLWKNADTKSSTAAKISAAEVDHVVLAQLAASLLVLPVTHPATLLFTLLQRMLLLHQCQKHLKLLQHQLLLQKRARVLASHKRSVLVLLVFSAYLANQTN